MRSLTIMALVTAMSLVSTPQSRATDVAEFYRGRTLTIAAHTHVGTYTDYAQLVAAHLGKHIPGNPSTSFQVIPGAGGLSATNHLYNIAPRDGTHLLMVVQTFALDEALASRNVRYQSRRLSVIGRISDNTSVFIGWNAAGVTSINTLRDREVIAGGTGAASPTDLYPTMLNMTAGTKVRLISGYKSLNEMLVAMQRGEIHSLVTSFASLDTVFASVWRGKMVSVLVQFAPTRHPQLPDIPTASEIIADVDGRALTGLLTSGSIIGRAVVAPPDIPGDRLAVLRSAFATMVNDDEFRKDSARRNLEVNPAPPAEIEGAINAVFDTSPNTIDRARTLMKAL